MSDCRSKRYGGIGFIIPPAMSTKTSDVNALKYSFSSPKEAETEIKHNKKLRFLSNSEIDQESKLQKKRKIESLNQKSKKFWDRKKRDILTKGQV